MPGVSVTTDIRQGAGGGDAVPSSTFFIVGTAERGPTDKAVLIRTTLEFERIFGQDNANHTLHKHVRTFFEEGGSRCYVARVAEGGTAATVDLLNDDDDVVATLTAVGVGSAYNAASGGVSITVEAGNNTSKKRIRAYLDGDLIWKSNDLGTRSEIVAAINANIGDLVTATSGATDELPVNDDYDLAGGTAASGENAADFIAGLDLFGYELGTGAVAMPGQPFSTSTVGTDLIAHCVANNRIALLAAAQATTDANLITAVSTWYDDDDTDRAAIYFPWVTIPDGVGGTHSISPESFVAAARARAHTEFGPWRPGAGSIASARYVNGLSLPDGVTYTRAAADALHDAQINTLRVVNGAVRVYGASTLSDDVDNWRFISYRDSVNYIVGRIEEVLEPYVFASIDGRGGIFAEVQATVQALLDPIAAQGGLFALVGPDGVAIDPGYSIQVDNVINTVATLAEGKIFVNVGLRLSAVSEMVNVTIYKSGLTTAV
jgi:hypothetical protein